jgi:hypothetical protein
MPPDLEFWLYGAVDPQTNEILQVSLHSSLVKADSNIFSQIMLVGIRDGRTHG